MDRVAAVGIRIGAGDGMSELLAVGGRDTHVCAQVQALGLERQRGALHLPVQLSSLAALVRHHRAFACYRLVCRAVGFPQL